LVLIPLNLRSSDSTARAVLERIQRARRVSTAKKLHCKQQWCTGITAQEWCDTLLQSVQCIIMVLGMAVMPLMWAEERCLNHHPGTCLPPWCACCSLARAFYWPPCNTPLVYWPPCNTPNLPFGISRLCLSLRTTLTISKRTCRHECAAKNFWILLSVRRYPGMHRSWAHVHAVLSFGATYSVKFLLFVLLCSIKAETVWDWAWAWRVIALELCGDLFWQKQISDVSAVCTAGDWVCTTQVPAAVAGSLVFAMLSRTGSLMPPEESFVQNDPVK